MNRPPPKGPSEESRFSDRVGRQARRRLHIMRKGQQNLWFGLGMMGLIGWSIVVPTLLGALIGQWLDQQTSGARSWTLTLLMAGLVLGCWNAWHWVSNQDKTMREEDNDDAQ